MTINTIPKMEFTSVGIVFIYPMQTFQQGYLINQTAL